MRNGKSQIKISFMLGFIAGEWQDWLWLSEQQPPVKIVFLFLNEELFWILLCKIAAAFLLVLKDWDSCNVLGASSANCYELFHSGKLVLELILKDDGRSLFGIQVDYQPFSSSNFVSRGSSGNKNLVTSALTIIHFKSSASLLNE